MLLALAMGSHGITLNIFDMLGNGVNPTEGYARTLRSGKSFLSAVAGLNLNIAVQRGIRVLFHRQSSEFIHCRSGTALEELYPKEVFWSQLLTCFGIANVLTADPGQRNEIVAVSGQYFRSISRRRIKDLFAFNLVLLDGEAVETLCDLGLGGLAGVRSCRWVLRDTDEITYEEVCDGAIYCTLADARMSAQGFAGDSLLVDYSATPELKSVLKDATGKIMGAGVAVQGRNAIILPYGHIPDFPLSHLMPVRQALIKSVLRELADERGTLLFTLDKPYLPLFGYEFRDKTVLFVANGSLDDADEVGVFVGNRRFKSAEIIDSATRRSRTVVPKCVDGMLKLGGTLRALEARAVILKA